MAASRRTSRPRFTLGLLVLTAITLITIDYRANGAGLTGEVRDKARDIFAPVGRVVDAVVSPVGNVIGGVLDFGRLKNENNRLRDELAQSRSAVVAAQDARRELRTALDALDLADVGDIPSVAARVTGGAASVLQFTIEINKGSDAGIARDMPVVSGGALVGRVVSVGASRSTVRLLSDPALSVGVRFSRTGDLGVVTGDGRDLTMGLVEPSTDVQLGDSVVTSGLQQSEYPPGLPVGKVTSAVRNQAQLAQDVRVATIVNLRRLSFVRVLQWKAR